MSRATLKQWWADNKTTAIWLTIWAVAAVWSITTAKQFTIWYVLLYLVDGICSGFCIGAVTVGWKWCRYCDDIAATRLEPIVSETYDGTVTVDVPRGAKFSALTLDMARKAYEGIRTEHPDWKTWEQLDDTAQWLLMANVDAGSRLTIRLAERFNNEEEEA